MDAMFALRMLMEKYREGQRELHICGPRESLRQGSERRAVVVYCMRKSGMAEKYVRLVQDMYEGSKTLVRCAVGTTESFKVKIALHQGSTLSRFCLL